MRSLNFPTHNSINVFDQCMTTVRNGDRRTRLESYRVRIIKADLLLANSKDSERWFKLKKEAATPFASDMEWLYTNKFVNKARDVYNALRKSIDICPLCDERDVDEIDHYLPKSKFPTFSVTPANLIPCCTNCNEIKAEVEPVSESKRTIHPYFDNLTGTRWLEVRVIEGAPAVLEFSVRQNLPQNLYLCVQHHFKELELGSLYSERSSRMMSRMQTRLRRRLAETGNPISIQNELTYDAADVRLHSWRNEALLSLAANEWYYSGGFDF